MGQNEVGSHVLDFLIQKCVDVAHFVNPRQVQETHLEVKSLIFVLTSHKIKDFPDKWVTRGW